MNGFSESGSSPASSGEVKAAHSVGSEGEQSNTLLFHDQNSAVTVYEQMHELRTQGHFCDVTLSVQGREIKAHKIMLASSSSYFRSMLLSGMVESRKDYIEIRDVDPNALDALVNFAYTSKLQITTDNVESLMTAAAMLVFNTAFEACADFLISQLHPSNCLGIRQFAENLNSTRLVDESSQFFLHHFLDVIKMEEQYLSLDAEVFRAFLCSDLINVTYEENVLEALLQWVEYSPSERRLPFPDLFQCIRLPLLSPAYIAQKVESNPFVKESHKCRDHISFAKDFHLGIVELAALPRQQWCLQRPRRAAAGTLYAIGGRGVSNSERPFNNVEVYDFYSNEWNEAPPLLTPRRHVGVVSTRGKVYAVGGENSGHHLRTVECYSDQERKWQQLSQLSIGRRGIAVGVLEGVIYAAGGLDDERSYNLVERYDHVSDKWTQVVPMNAVRCGAGAVALGRYLYVVGGNDGESSTNSVERYDPHLNKWSEVAPMNCKRAGGGMAALGGFIYAVGGFADVLPLNNAERYNPATDEWTFIAPMGVSRGGLGLAVLGGYLFALGGHNGREYLTLAETYDPQEDKWTAIASMKLARAGVGVAVCPPPPQDSGTELGDSSTTTVQYSKSCSPPM